MTPLRLTAISIGVLLILSALAFGQEAIEKPKLDYSYCRFDSTTAALMDQYIPLPIRQGLASGSMHPRFLPVYMTAEDVNFDDPKGLPTHKILYANNGRVYASLVVLKRGDDGTYTPTWSTQQVPPAPRVRLRIKDLNGDGRLDVIASARGGEPAYEAMIAFELNPDGIGRSMVSKFRTPHDPRATIGIGLAIIDSLGRNGKPAIEIWQDDSTHAGQDFVRIVQHYSDSARIFLPELIDTVPELPFWCSVRRPKDAGQK
jgi:hypothetical protein